MSYTRVKTTYSLEGPYGGTETVELYCHHNHSCDITTFYDKDGSVTEMQFWSWDKGNDLWDAMERLIFPFKDKWGGELKDNVECYGAAPWEEEEDYTICSECGANMIEKWSGIKCISCGHTECL